MFNKLKTLYKKWVKIGKRVAAFQIRVLFTLTYIVIIIPYGLIFRIFTSHPKSGWREVKENEISLESARKQY